MIDNFLSVFLKATLTILIGLSIYLSICLSLLSIVLGRSSKLNSLSTQSRCNYIFAGRPKLIRPYFSSRASYVLFVLFGWFVKWEADDFWGVPSRICSKQHVAFLCSSHLAFLSTCFVLIYVVHLYRSIYTGAAWKNSCFIFSVRSDYQMIDNQSTAFHALARHMLTLPSVDEIFLPMYMNWSTNFRGLPLEVETATSGIKHLNSCFHVRDSTSCCLIQVMQ